MVTTALYMAAETKPRYSWVTGGGFSPWTTIVRTAMASQVLITAGSLATRGVAWAGLVSAAGVASSSAATMTTVARTRIPLRMELPPTQWRVGRAIGEEALPAATIGSIGANAIQAHKVLPRPSRVKDQICTWDAA